MELIERLNQFINSCPFKDLRGSVLLSGATLTILALIAIAMAFISDGFEFTALAFIMVICAGGTVAMLTYQMLHMKTIVEENIREATAYRELNVAQVLCTSSGELISHNKLARENIWWGQSVADLRMVIVEEEKFDIFLLHVQSGRTDEACFTLRNPKGKNEIWKFHSEPLGELSLLTYEDVTESYRSDAEQQARLDTLERMIEGAPGAIFSLNDKGVIH